MNIIEDDSKKGFVVICGKSMSFYKFVDKHPKELKYAAGVLWIGLKRFRDAVAKSEKLTGK